MSYGLFKFVLDDEANLYIGFSHDFHMDICGNLPRDKVIAAGYIAYQDGTPIPNGKSIGYGIGCSGHEDLVKKILEGKSRDDLVDMLADLPDQRLVLSEE